MLELHFFPKFINICLFRWLLLANETFQVSEMGYSTELWSQKMVLNFFYCEVENIFLDFAFFQFFFYMISFNKVRKLEVAEPNPVIENIPVSFSLCRLGFPFFLVHFFISLSHTLYLSPSLFVAALHLLFCGVM